MNIEAPDLTGDNQLQQQQEHLDNHQQPQPVDEHDDQQSDDDQDIQQLLQEHPQDQQHGMEQQLQQLQERVNQLTQQLNAQHTRDMPTIVQSMKISIGDYEMGGPFVQWLREFELQTSTYGMTDEEKCRMLPLLLKANARNQYANIPEAVRLDYQQLRTELRTLFDTRITDRPTAVLQLTMRKMVPGEDVNKFIADITWLVENAVYQEAAPHNEEPDARTARMARNKRIVQDHILLHAQQNATPPLRRYLANGRYNNVTELVQEALKWQALKDIDDENGEMRKMTAMIAQMETTLKNTEAQLRQTTDKTKWRSNQKELQPSTPTCQICNKRGHTAERCYQRHKTGNERQKQLAQGRQEGNTNIQCGNCGKKGNSTQQCYKQRFCEHCRMTNHNTANCGHLRRQQQQGAQGGPPNRKPPYRPPRQFKQVAEITAEDEQPAAASIMVVTAQPETSEAPKTRTEIIEARRRQRKAGKATIAAVVVQQQRNKYAETIGQQPRSPIQRSTELPRGHRAKTQVPKWLLLALTLAWLSTTAGAIVHTSHSSYVDTLLYCPTPANPQVFKLPPEIHCKMPSSIQQHQQPINITTYKPNRVTHRSNLKICYRETYTITGKAKVSINSKVHKPSAAGQQRC